MRENRVRKVWAQGGTAIGGWLSIGNSFSAEVMAHQPFDFLVADTQHGMVDVGSAVGMLQAISTAEPAPMARVTWNDPATIMKLLDSGAYGIICPMINTRAECEQFVGACRYPPAGYRSFGPARGTLYGGDDYFEHADKTVLTLAMIETRQAVDNLDAIASVSGLDGLFIGPGDLCISLGHAPSMEPTEKDVVAAIDAVVAAARKHKIVAGMYCVAGTVARRWAERGFRFVAIGSDVRFLTASATAQLQAARGA